MPNPTPFYTVHGQEAKHNTRVIYQSANEPKELILYPATEHGLRECKDELHDLLRQWIPDKLDRA